MVLVPGVLNGTVSAQDNMFTHPLEIFMLWHGGMSFHGGALGVITAVLVFAWRNHIHPLRLGDTVAPLREVLAILEVRRASFDRDPYSGPARDYDKW